MSLSQQQTKSIKKIIRNSLSNRFKNYNPEPAKIKNKLRAFKKWQRKREVFEAEKRKI